MSRPSSRRHRRSAPLRRLLAVLALLLVAGSAAAAEHRFALQVGNTQQTAIPLARTELAEAAALRVRWRRERASTAVGRVSAALELTLVGSDGRQFHVADPVAIDDRDGSVRIPLDAAHWGGDDGVLGVDALGALARLVVRVHADEDGGAIEGGIDHDAAPGDTPSFTVELPDGGLVDRGAWRELRVRLAGHRDGERGELELVDGDRRLPLFLDQQLTVVDGWWHARGAPRWTLRLRPGETGAGHLEWRHGDDDWRSQRLPELAVVRAEPLPDAPRQSLPLPQAPAWAGRPSVRDGDGHLLQPRVELGPCPAPVLAWNAGWGGFRGGDRIAWPQAAACDRAFAAGMAEIDLAPQGLLEEQGAFRFGLSPWHAAQGGPWSAAAEAWTHDEPWRDWRAHARAVVARARATPGLERWRLGIRAMATGDAAAARARALVDDVATMVAAVDGRPALIVHPQAVDYAYDDRKAPGSVGSAWYGFADGPGEWKAGPPPISGQLEKDAEGSDGDACLRVPLATRGARPGEMVGGAYLAPDTNLFNLEELQLDACAAGDGTVQLYAWASDEHHRWFQQRLAWMPCDGRWRTVSVPFGDDAPWEAQSREASWGPGARRRIRRFGIVAFHHPQPGSSTPAVLKVDRVRRFGWPREAEPTLAFTERSTAAAEVAQYDAFACDFQLSLPARNPYDPDHADVVGEVEGPGGIRHVFPAYWEDPMRIEWRDGREHVVPAGAGSWRWRFMPTAQGPWRWRIRAKVKWRDRWTEAETPWHDVKVVAPAAGTLPPVRVSTRDPMWFETLDGGFFYPVGVNLRSPGDDRQDQVMSQLPRTPAGDVNDIHRPLTRSSGWETMGTRAYERWFPRLAANGCNWARVWMAPWWCGLEWTRAWDGYGGVGWYSQSAAARMDRVVELARQHGIYVQVELMNHGMGGESADSQWADSPYNVRNGGTCRTAAELFSRDDAKAATAKRYRYTVARWGWRSHIAAWVLTSEMEWTAAWYSQARDDEHTHSPLAETWTRHGLDWFKANDAIQRPVSIHFSHPWVGIRLWPLQGLGFNNSNAYTGFQDFGRLGGQYGRQRDLPLGLDFYLTRHYGFDRLRRPTLVGEWGGHWSDNDSRVLTQELHVGLWVQAVTPYAGNTGFWWWLWIDAADQWKQYAAVAAFVAGEDRRGLGYRTAKPAVSGGGARVSVMGMASSDEHRYYAWLTGLDQSPGLSSGKDAGNARIETGHARSRWRVERWSTSEGKREEAGELTADEQGALALPLGKLAPDAAFKLTRLHFGP